jgi:hypothetical protein
MRMPPRDSRTVAFAAIAIGAGMLLGIAGGLQPYRPVEFSGLIVSAILTSGLARRRPTAEDRGTMPPSFVVDFISLLLFGPGPAMLVASAGAITKGRLADSEPFEAPRRTLLDALIAMIAILAAGFAHRVLGGTMGHFVWPSQGLPIAAAVIAYSLVRSASAQVITPLVASQPYNRA